jgi:hypothetical protein
VPHPNDYTRPLAPQPPHSAPLPPPNPPPLRLKAASHLKRNIRGRLVSRPRELLQKAAIVLFSGISEAALLDDKIAGKAYVACVGSALVCLGETASGTRCGAGPARPPRPRPLIVVHSSHAPPQPDMSSMETAIVSKDMEAMLMAYAPFIYTKREVPDDISKVTVTISEVAFIMVHVSRHWVGKHPPLTSQLGMNPVNIPLQHNNPGLPFPRPPIPATRTKTKKELQRHKRVLQGTSPSDNAATDPEDMGSSSSSSDWSGSSSDDATEDDAGSSGPTAKRRRRHSQKTPAKRRKGKVACDMAKGTVLFKAWREAKARVEEFLDDKDGDCEVVPYTILRSGG